MQFDINGGGSISAERILTVALLLVACTILGLIGNDYYYSLQLHKIEAVNQEMLKKQQEQYRQQQEQAELINRKFHDIRHYVTVLENLKDLDAIRVYSEDLKEKLSPLGTLYASGNPIVDVILAQKTETCEQENIQLIPCVDASEMNFIQSLDLCTIFDNLLDNAIEATSQIPDTKKRIIEIRARKIKQMIVITTQNYYQGTLRKRGGELLTTKANEAGHGYGIYNIQQAVKKYKGTMSYKTENDDIVFTILIPLPSPIR